jgi:hypothetical protein
MSEQENERATPAVGDHIQCTQQTEEILEHTKTSVLNEQPVRFSALLSSMPMGKTVWLEGGALKKTVRNTPGNFELRPLEIFSIQDLAQAFKEANERTIFVTGLHHKSNGTTVWRNKDDFFLNHGPGVMYLDNDTHPGLDQFHDLYVLACPAMASASYVHAPSSGTYIFGKDGKEYAGANGQHYAMPVMDASDIPRALTALHHRCILSGQYVISVTASGRVQIKSPVDTHMQISNQPLFHRVSVVGDLEQRKEMHITAHEGEAFLFDTRLIESLTGPELATLTTIEAKLRTSIEHEAAKVREQWIAARADDVALANGWTMANARKNVQQTLSYAGSAGANVDLCAGHKINFDEFGQVDVADVIANPDFYNGKTCDDPIEPSYKPGTQVAKCYARASDGSQHLHPCIHSYAHGACNIYHLKRDLSSFTIDLDAAIRAQELRKAAAVKDPQEIFVLLPDGSVVDLGCETPSFIADFRIMTMPTGLVVTEFVIDGFLPNGVVVIAGEPGSGKTTNLVPMAASAAHLTPKEWGFHPKRRRKVVWLSEHPEQVFDTFEALLVLEGSASRQEFEQWFVVVQTKRSATQNLVTMVEDANRRFSWQNERGVAVNPLIVWDTAAATIEVETENDNATISRAISMAKVALDGGALWVVTHTPKAQRGARDEKAMSARGAGAYEADANCTAYLYQDTDERRVLALGKIRFAPAFTEIHFDSARDTKTIIDNFDGEELEKIVVCGVPSQGSKDQRKQSKVDIRRQAQRDAILQEAVKAVELGLLPSRNNIYERMNGGIQKVEFLRIISLMIDGGQSFAAE